MKLQQLDEGRGNASDDVVLLWLLNEAVVMLLMMLCCYGNLMKAMIMLQSDVVLL